MLCFKTLMLSNFKNVKNVPIFLNLEKISSRIKDNVSRGMTPELMSLKLIQEDFLQNFAKKKICLRVLMFDAKHVA